LDITKMKQLIRDMASQQTTNIKVAIEWKKRAIEIVEEMEKENKNDRR
jgi:hypothetical protein